MIFWIKAEDKNEERSKFLRWITILEFINSFAKSVVGWAIIWKNQTV